MSAKEHLQPLQFNTEGSDESYHMLSATHPEHGEVGYMTWAKKDTGLHQPGEIANIVSFLPRRGVATALYHHAVANYQPTPLHSQNLTRNIKGRPELGGGRSWAASVGGPSVKPRKKEKWQ